jgi:hypothetical protein
VPECRDCRRVLPTCEVRRLPSGGWRCKDAGKGTRCWTLARELREQEKRERRRRHHGETLQAEPVKRQGVQAGGLSAPLRTREPSACTESHPPSRARDRLPSGLEAGSQLSLEELQA